MGLITANMQTKKTDFLEHLFPWVKRFSLRAVLGHHLPGIRHDKSSGILAALSWMSQLFNDPNLSTLGKFPCKQQCL